jgi:hypothetical protein
LTLSDNVYVNSNDLLVVLYNSVRTNLVWKCIHLSVLFIVSNNIIVICDYSPECEILLPNPTVDRVMSGKKF